MGPPGVSRRPHNGILLIYWASSHPGITKPKLATASVDKSLELINLKINNAEKVVRTEFKKQTKDVTPAPKVGYNCFVFTLLPCIFTAKSIMLLALIYWVIYLVPVYLESLEMAVTIVWLGATLLLFIKKDYAGLLIAPLAAYNFVHDLIVELPKFNSTAIHIASTQNIAQSTASVSLIVLLCLEAVFLACFLYFVAYILQPTRRYPF